MDQANVMPCVRTNQVDKMAHEKDKAICSVLTTLKITNLFLFENMIYYLSQFLKSLAHSAVYHAFFTLILINFAFLIISQQLIYKKAGYVVYYLIIYH